MFFKNPTHLSLLIFGSCLLFAQLYAGHIHPYRSFYHEFVITVGVFVAFIPYSLSAKPKLVFPAVGLLVLSLIAWIGLQSLLDISSVAAIYYPIFMLFAAILAMGLGASWVKYSGNASSLCCMFALVYLAAAVLSVAMQQVQILGLDWRPLVMYMGHDGVNPIRAFANVAQPNQLALLICFGLISLWWMLQNTRFSGLLAWCLAVFLLWGLVLTQSRIAWIILPGLAAFVLSHRPSQKSTSFWVGVGSLLLIYVFLLISLPTIAKYLGFVAGTIGERVGGRSERTVLLQQAWTMASSHPWLGVGWFGFGAQQVAHAANFSASIYAEHSHNLILNFAAELGIPYTVFFFLTFSVFLWKTCFARGRLHNQEILFFVMLLFAVAVHSLVEFPLWYAYVLLPVGVCLGALCQLRWQSANISLSLNSFHVIAVICLSLLTWAWFDYHRVVDGFVAFRQEKNYDQIPAAKIQAPAWTLLPEYYDYFKLMRISPATGMSSEDIQFVEKTSLRFGYVHILSKQAEIYALNHRSDAALQTMVRLQRLHPWSYPEYYDYWKVLAQTDTRFAQVFSGMPARDVE